VLREVPIWTLPFDPSRHEGRRPLPRTRGDMGFIVSSTYRWPGGKIPYMRGYCTEEVFEVVKQVMTKWEDETKEFAGKSIIAFEYIGTEKDWLAVPAPERKKRYPQCFVRVESTAATERTDAGCVGLLHAKELRDGSGKRINFAIKYGDLKNIPHEVGHIIGLAHEHMRLDSGLAPIGEPGIGKYNETALKMDLEQQNREVHGPYDPKSIMHYEGEAIAANYVIPAAWAQTVRAQPEGVAVAAGAWEPSRGDKAAVRAMYW
jgi:Astacin (Peptidase family M12A)